MRRSSRGGRYAERVLVGVDDAGNEERIALWIERRAEGLGCRTCGQSPAPGLRRDEAGGPDLRGYELEDALQRANEALEDDVVVLEGDGREAEAKPFTRKEVLPVLERWFFNR